MITGEQLGALVGPIRKMGFGFAFGCGAGGLAYIFLHANHPELKFVADHFFYSGGLIGFAANKVLDKIFKFFISPITSRLGFYTRIFEINQWLNRGFIDAKKAKELTDTSINQLFGLNQPTLKTIQLPVQPTNGTDSGNG